MNGFKGLPLLVLAASTCFLLTYYVVDSELAATIEHMNNEIPKRVSGEDLSVEDRIQIQREMLSRFGIPMKLKSTSRNVKGSAPNSLNDIYKSLEHRNEQNTDYRQDRTMRSILSYVGKLNDRVVQESDEIITLYMSNHSNDVRDGNGFEIIFDIDNEPSVETHRIISAEVYLYKTASSPHVENGVYSVTLYQIIDGKNGDTRLEYLDSQNVAAEFEGWLHFNTTIVLVTWTQVIHPNRGLFVKVQPLDEALFDDQDQDVIILNEDVKKPFMIVYLKSEDKIDSEVDDIPLINHSSVKVLRKKVDHQSSETIDPLQLFMVQPFSSDSNVNIIGDEQKE